MGLGSAVALGIVAFTATAPELATIGAGTGVLVGAGAGGVSAGTMYLMDQADLGALAAEGAAAGVAAAGIGGVIYASVHKRSLWVIVSNPGKKPLVKQTFWKDSGSISGPDTIPSGFTGMVEFGNDGSFSVVAVSLKKKTAKYIHIRGSNPWAGYNKFAVRCYSSSDPRKAYNELDDWEGTERYEITNNEGYRAQGKHYDNPGIAQVHVYSQ
eukprot:TRINITY_DN10111_c0_g2_i2.p1 TRINITY_DN10111_c0_g2~~TRINITY_DN10111_c0_g2_i2.p1  ORF type:complete len:212 (+),score=60.99 TRINITY_DN10111_c0_g2_i2:86-721(+)